MDDDNLQRAGAVSAFEGDMRLEGEPTPNPGGPSVPFNPPRLLKTYYPGPGRRQRALYLFAHCFLPLYVHRHAQPFFDSLVLAERAGPGQCVGVIQGLWNSMEETYGLVKRAASLEADLNTPLRWVRDLRAWFKPLAGSPALIIEMPRPPVSGSHLKGTEGLPLAYYLGALQVASNQARVFTLEQAFSTLGRGLAWEATAQLCEWTRDGRHHRLCQRVLPSRDEFAVALMRVMTVGDLPAG